MTVKDCFQFVFSEMLTLDRRVGSLFARKIRLLLPVCVGPVASHTTNVLFVPPTFGVANKHCIS
jgi:hypothetical protein